MEHNLKYWLLKVHILSDSLNENDLKELWTIADHKILKAGHIIYKADESISKVYFVKQGRIKVAYSHSDKNEVVSEILKEGDIFGELSLQDSENINGEYASVISQEASICSFSLIDFENILKNKPAFMLAYTKMLTAKLKTISSKYADLVFKDVKERVINFFRIHAVHEAQWNNNRAEINMYFTHTEIAHFTASSRQTVSTIIGELIKDKKIIYEGRSKVIIPDITLL